MSIQETSQDTKAWYESKSVWGGLLAVVAGIAGVFGYAVSPEDQAVLAEAAVSIVSVAGGLLAVFGRIKASKAIK